MAAVRQRNGPDTVLRPVVVDEQHTAAELAHQRGPSFVVVVAGPGFGRALGHLPPPPRLSRSANAGSRLANGGSALSRCLAGV